MSTAPKRQPVPFGKYLLLDRVNIGGMAEVWRAKTFGAGGFERLVAIKRILPNIAEDEEFITMFIDEAKITVQLAHANVAQIYELSHLSNSYFIAMEYISGKDMRAIFDRCRKRGEPAPIPLICHLISKCCEGLDYAHRKKDQMGRELGIVHRDVSPQNALISYDGEVKVIDFGIAKAAGKATKTQAGILKGKFGYMSPEQIRGLPLDRRSDIFAIGVCLYEMLTGERLFVGDSDFSVLEKVRKVEVLPPSHFNRKIPEQLEKIVMKALAKDVDDRYQWATDLAEDLNRFIYTTGAGFGRMELAAFMKATFAEDYEKEKSRMQEYAEIKPTEAMIALAEMTGGMGFPGAGPAKPPADGGGGGANLPSVAPQVRASQANLQPVRGPPPGATSGLPPLARPAGPHGASPGRAPSLNMAAPGRAPSVAMAAPGRAPSLASMPRLTAAAPALQTEKEEHNATMLVDSSSDDENTNTSGLKNLVKAAAARPGPPVMGDEGPELATDPGRPALKLPLPVGPGTDTNPQLDPVPTPAFPQVPPGVRPGPPVMTNPGNMPRVGGPPMIPGGPPVIPGGPPRLGVAPNPSMDTAESSSTLPFVAPGIGGVSEQKAGGGKKLLVFGLLAVALLAAAGVGAALFLKEPPNGLVIVEVPSAVAEGKARLNINGKEITGPGGTPITEWPQIVSVPAGKATVRLIAEGYETVVETVVVKEGFEPTQLTKKLKKKEAAPE